MDTKSIQCPLCKENGFMLKYIATYEYSYIVDTDAPGRCNTDELLSYLYDNREQKESKQYLECRNCGAKYPCYFDHWNKKISEKELQEAIYSSWYNKEQQE